MDVLQYSQKGVDAAVQVRCVYVGGGWGSHHAAPTCRLQLLSAATLVLLLGALLMSLTQPGLRPASRWTQAVSWPLCPALASLSLAPALLQAASSVVFTLPPHPTPSCSPASPVARCAPAHTPPHSCGTPRTPAHEGELDGL